MRLGRKGRGMKRAGPTSTDSSWESGGIFQLQKLPPEEQGVSTKSMCMGEEEPIYHWAVKINGDLSARERQYSAQNPGALLKEQHTKSHSWPLSLGSSREREDQSKLETWEDKQGVRLQGKS